MKDGRRLEEPPKLGKTAGANNSSGCGSDEVALSVTPPKVRGPISIMSALLDSLKVSLAFTGRKTCDLFTFKFLIKLFISCRKDFKIVSTRILLILSCFPVFLCPLPLYLATFV